MGELPYAECASTVTPASLASSCNFALFCVQFAARQPQMSLVLCSSPQHSTCAQVLLFYPDGKKSSSTEGHLAPPGLPAPGPGNAGGNQQGGGQGQVLHLPIPPGPIPGNANGTPASPYSVYMRRTTANSCFRWKRHAFAAHMTTCTQN